jgi:hypothetical protein
MIQVEREKKNDSGRDRSGEVKKQAKMLWLKGEEIGNSKEDAKRSSMDGNQYKVNKNNQSLLVLILTLMREEIVQEMRK